MRVTNDEIESTIEMFVNCVYDNGKNSGWMDASFDDWVEVVYRELTTWKSKGWSMWESKENRFDGKESIVNRIKPLLTKRLTELKDEGYDIKAI